jgi:hypothetical protein
MGLASVMHAPTDDDVTRLTASKWTVYKTIIIDKSKMNETKTIEVAVR